MCFSLRHSPTVPRQPRNCRACTHSLPRCPCGSVGTKDGPCGSCGAGTPLPVMFDAAWYGKTTTTVPKAGFTDDLWKLHLAARGASEVVVMSTKMDGLKLVVRTRVDFPAGGDPDAKALFDELAGNSRPAWLTGALNGGAVVAALSRGELRQPAAPPPPPTPPAVTFKDPQIYDNPLDWCSSWGPTFDGGKCGLFVANRSAGAAAAALLLLPLRCCSRCPRPSCGCRCFVWGKLPASLRPFHRAHRQACNAPLLLSLPPSPPCLLSTTGGACCRATQRRQPSRALSPLQAPPACSSTTPWMGTQPSAPAAAKHLASSPALALLRRRCHRRPPCWPIGPQHATPRFGCSLPGCLVTTSSQRRLRATTPAARRAPRRPAAPAGGSLKVVWVYTYVVQPARLATSCVPSCLPPCLSAHPCAWRPAVCGLQGGCTQCGVGCCGPACEHTQLMRQAARCPAAPRRTWKPDGGGSCTLKNAASSAYYTATRSAPDGTIFRALGRRQLARGCCNGVECCLRLLPCWGSRGRHYTGIL